MQFDHETTGTGILERLAGRLAEEPEQLVLQRDRDVDIGVGTGGVGTDRDQFLRFLVGGKQLEDLATRRQDMLVDQAIGGTIFLCLTVLSFLPLTWLQTSTLYNAKFAANLRWRARREMFLDNLMA